MGNGAVFPLSVVWRLQLFSCVTTQCPRVSANGKIMLNGEASYLHVYNLSSGEQCDQIHLLGPHTIHGIRKGWDGLHAAYGQKAISVFYIECGENIRLSVLCECTEFSDWVLDVAFLRHDESPPSVMCLGLILAHNSVVLWDWKRKVCIQHVHSAENCILYSARLLGDSWDGLTVAAGTVFNQVVLWKPSGPRDTLGRVQVERRLSGHQGVIFNLSYHKDRKLLCSVSDDRSIRLWPLGLENTPQEQSDAAQMVMYGHSARVWDAKILDHTIVSVGEDATCCVWNNSGDIVHRFTGHKGRSIWSLAVHDNQKLIVTGGGDSSIRIWNIDTKQEECITTEELDIQAETTHIVLDESSHPNSGPEMTASSDAFIPRQLAVLNSGKIIVMTLNGCLLCYTLRSKQWQLLSHDPQYQSYSLLSVCPTHNMAALGNIQGQVKIVALDTGQTMGIKSVFTGKVFSFCWVYEDNLFVSGPDGLVIWWKLSKSMAGYCIKEEAVFQLPEASQRWATTIVLVPHQEGTLICGDRRGSILLYTELHSAAKDKNPAGPTYSLPCVHGKGGVTHVCHHAGYIYSTGRDGTYRQYTLQGTRLQMMNTYKVYKGFNWIESLSFTADDDVLVSGFHASSFIVWSPGSNETLLQIQCGGGHRAWGFATCQVHLTQGETNPVPGGTFPTPGESSARMDGTDRDRTLAVFACIKAKKIIVCTAPGERLQQHPILKDGLHGRRVNCIKYLATVTLPEGECAVCATGSEDNSVNIAAVILCDSKPSTIHVLHRLHVHISSVHCLATCSSSYTSDWKESRGVTEVKETGQRLLLFSVGARRAIQCWRVTLPKQCLLDEEHIHQWLKTSCCVEHLAFYGNTDNVKQRRWLKKHGRPIDPETRFMSVCVWKGSDLTGCRRSEDFLGVVGSDACIRIFVFNEQTKDLFPLVSTDWQNCCLLTTVSIVHACPWGPAPLLLTAGTSGEIALWDVQKAIGECGKDGTVCKAKESCSGEYEVREQECIVGVVDMEQDAGALTRIDDSAPCDQLHTFQTLTGKELRTSRNHLDTKRTISSSLQMQDLDQPKPLMPSLQASSAEPLDYEESFHQEESDALWDTEGDIGRLLLSVKAHQSGINALCVSQLDDSLYLLASGGDDNSIKITLLSVSYDETHRHLTVNLNGTHTIICAHAAQVSGLSFVDTNTLASSSIDQRLNVWRVQLSSDEEAVMKVDQLSSKHSLIADCADMASWTSRCGGHWITVCGQGLQVQHLKEDLGTSLGPGSLSS